MTRRPTILTVDDSPAALMLLDKILSPAGYHVLSADSGELALAAVAADPPDLILLDIHMPGIGGLETCRRLKLSEKTRQIPVILCSASTDTKDWVEGLRLGAADYIIKPCRNEELLSRVRTHIALSLATDSLARQAVDLHHAVEQLQSEVVERRRVEEELRQNLDGTEKSRLTLLSTLEDRKRMEDALRVSEERHRSILHTAMDGFWLTDTQGRLLEVNDSYCRMTGYSVQELQAMGIHDLEFVETADETSARVRKIIEKGQDRFETRHRCKDGSAIDVEVSVQYKPSEGGRLVVFVRDITQRKQAEEERRRLEGQIRMSQKMEAIGSLAGGVAHDFNNILTAQIGYCDLMKSGLRDEDPLARSLAQIKACAVRAATLTRQLLAFSRKQTLQPEVLDLNVAVGNIEQMLRRVVGEDVAFATALTPGLARVKADPGQIDQVIMNLVVNARDAMLQGGKLTLETSNVELDEDYARVHVGAHAGPHVMLAITDTGCGMDEKTKSRLYEPFFTTKEQGKGTGLGLATIYGIVTQSGGSIAVYSEPGRGTTFRVYLPQVEAEPAPPAARTAQPARGQGELILVAEDEPVLRDLFTLMLERLGYRVQVAANGGEALIAVEEKGLRPDLLITDVVMPGMSGRVLAERLVRTQPGLRVLYASGYTADAVVHHGVLDHKMPFLQKPFSIGDLAAKIQELLHAKG